LDGFWASIQSFSASYFFVGTLFVSLWAGGV
jgi:hypothetical protein